MNFFKKRLDAAKREVATWPAWEQKCSSSRSPAGSTSGLKPFDIVEVVTSRYQEEPNLATVLELIAFEGEEAAVIQYHYNSCSPCTVCTRYMKKHLRR